MLKDFVIAFGLAMVWWLTGFPMSVPTGAPLLVRDEDEGA